ncbi:MAG TPA: GcrA cell cycle regulator, partial [Lachnospiraceae bacterium]|nr:GcrA cell cycle regulator [Lachnospiraceae bacterium]HBH69939.1 GcrA cell cycle regulator [Lachnospiraceae bacterium]
PDAVRRPQRPAGAAGADPRQRMNDAPQQAPQRPSRPVKNFAADDDFDYDFINMDDDNQ